MSLTLGALSLAPATMLAATVSITCGGTSDGAAINTAITGSNPGDTIQFHGTCVTNQTIVLLGKRNYYGDSRNTTTIQQAAGSNLAALLASDSWVNNTSTAGDPIRIAHLNLDGNSAANSGTSVLVLRSWLSHIEDLAVQNAAVDGILIPSASSGGTQLAGTTMPGVNGTEVNSVIDKVWVNHSGANGIHVVDSGDAITDWFLLDSAIQDSGASAIYLGNAAGWMVRGNHVYGVQNNGILASRCYGTTIEGNYIEQFGTAGGTGNTWYGIIASLAQNAASVISGNKIFMFQGVANSANLLYLDVTGHDGADQATVSDNTIFGHNGSTETGLTYTLGSGTSIYIASTGNSVQNVATPITVGTGVTKDAGR
jgi:parallel beta-helix repeat protein